MFLIRVESLAQITIARNVQDFSNFKNKKMNVSLLLKINLSSYSIEISKIIKYCSIRYHKFFAFT